MARALSKLEKISHVSGIIQDQAGQCASRLCFSWLRSASRCDLRALNTLLASPSSSDELRYHHKWNLLRSRSNFEPHSRSVQNLLEQPAGLFPGLNASPPYRRQSWRLHSQITEETDIRPSTCHEAQSPILNPILLSRHVVRT